MNGKRTLITTWMAQVAMSDFHALNGESKTGME